MQELFGLIGYPVRHSLSPAMMNTAFDKTAMDARYHAFPVEPAHLSDALRGLYVLGFRGVNVTIPHKESVYRLLERVSEAAGLAKAVNTLVRDADGWTGHNTDVEGWWSSFDEQRPTPDSTVAILGAGGAARGVLVGLAVHAPLAKVTVSARRVEQAELLCAQFGSHLDITARAWEDRHKSVDEAEFVVQSTPIGMWPNDKESCLEDVTCLHRGQVVQDLVYRPIETKFLLQAKHQGAHIIDGARMLVGQGAQAFTLWTGQHAPIQDMRQAVLQRLV